MLSTGGDKVVGAAVVWWRLGTTGWCVVDELGPLGCSEAECPCVRGKVAIALVQDDMDNK